MPQAEFEERLMKRLREEIKMNRAQLEIDLKQELASEKKRLLGFIDMGVAMNGEVVEYPPTNADSVDWRD